MRYLGLEFIPGMVVCRTQLKTDIHLVRALEVVCHNIHDVMTVAVGMAMAVDMSPGRVPGAATELCGHVDTAGTTAVGAIQMAVAGPIREGRSRIGLVEKARLAYGDPPVLIQAGIMTTIESSFSHQLRGFFLVVLVVVTVVVNVIVVA